MPGNRADGPEKGKINIENGKAPSQNVRGLGTRCHRAYVT